MASTSADGGRRVQCVTRLDRPVRAKLRGSCLPICSSSQSACPLERTAETRFPGSTQAFRIAAEKRRPGAVPSHRRNQSPGDTMRSMILRAGLVLASAVLSFSASGPEHLDRDRRHRRRLLPARRRHRRGPLEACARHAGDRRGHRRIGRQPEADRQRQALHRLRDDRREPGRAARRGQVQGCEGAAEDADGAVPEPHARRLDRGPRRHQDGRPEGQARLDRLAGQRDRGDGVPRDRGGRPRQGQRHEARAPRRRRIGQRDQGRQDRRVLLGRRPADRVGDRPREHAGHQAEDDRPRRRGAQR